MQSDNVQLYLKLSTRLSALIKVGEDEGQEGATIVDKLYEIWARLSKEQRVEVRKILKSARRSEMIEDYANSQTEKVWADIDGEDFIGYEEEEMYDL